MTKEKEINPNIQKETINTTTNRFSEIYFMISVSEYGQETLDSLDTSGKRAWIAAHMRVKPKTVIPDGKEGQYFQEALNAFSKIL